MPGIFGKHPEALQLLAHQRSLTKFFQAVHAHKHIDVNGL
jgi:hypothetical protein